MTLERFIKYLVAHCTATQPEATIAAILNYWKTKLGWKNPGYHYLIKRDGEIVQLHPEHLIANGVAGFNANSIHVSYIGGVDRNNKPVDNRTPAQQEAMFNLFVELSERYPNAEILGHRDFPNVAKACPSFDTRSWLQNYEPDFGMAA